MTSSSPIRRRRRLPYLGVVVGVIVLGLASRRFPAMFPPGLGKYPGDALWAVMMFLWVGIIRAGWSTWRVALGALGICSAVEFSQLYHTDWIDAIRGTTLGHLVLGSGFQPQDLLAYAAGVALAALGERLWRRSRS